MRVGNSSMKGYLYTNPEFDFIRTAARFKPIDENDLYIPVQYCSVFGCGKLLTLPEKLCGCRCTGHIGKKVFEFYGNY